MFLLLSSKIYFDQFAPRGGAVLKIIACLNWRVIFLCCEINIGINTYICWTYSTLNRDFKRCLAAVSCKCIYTFLQGSLLKLKTYASVVFLRQKWIKYSIPIYSWHFLRLPWFVGSSKLKELSSSLLVWPWTQLYFNSMYGLRHQYKFYLTTLNVTVARTWLKFALLATKWQTPLI